MFKLRLPANGNYPEVVIELHEQGISVTEIKKAASFSYQPGTTPRSFIWELGELVAIDNQISWTASTMIWGIGGETLMEFKDADETEIDTIYHSGSTSFCEITFTGNDGDKPVSIKGVVDIAAVDVFARAFKALVVHQLRKVFGD